MRFLGPASNKRNWTGILFYFLLPIKFAAKLFSYTLKNRLEAHPLLKKTSLIVFLACSVNPFSNQTEEHWRGLKEILTGDLIPSNLLLSPFKSRPHV